MQDMRRHVTAYARCMQASVCEGMRGHARACTRISGVEEGAARAQLEYAVDLPRQEAKRDERRAALVVVDLPVRDWDAARLPLHIGHGRRGISTHEGGGCRAPLDAREEELVGRAAGEKVVLTGIDIGWSAVKVSVGRVGS